MLSLQSLVLRSLVIILGTLLNYLAVCTKKVGKDEDKNLRDCYSRRSTCTLTDQQETVEIPTDNIDHDDIMSVRALSIFSTKTSMSSLSAPRLTSQASCPVTLIEELQEKQRIRSLRQAISVNETSLEPSIRID